MFIKIPFKTIKERHPKQVEEILNKLRKSKSIQKGSKPDELTWGYTFSIRCESSFNLNDLINGNIPPKKEMTYDEKVADLLSRTNVTVGANKGHWGGYSEDKIENPPDEIISWAKEASKPLPPLSPDQLENNLKELMKDPGFVHIKLLKTRGGK